MRTRGKDMQPKRRSTKIVAADSNVAGREWKGRVTAHKENSGREQRHSKRGAAESNGPNEEAGWRPQTDMCGPEQQCEMGGAMERIGVEKIVVAVSNGTGKDARPGAKARARRRGGER
eukprot:gb/GEZJ01004032.1/.p2 GENE.gb/GEZJ01004032.1/~~gb/GEZJ01004032.1/.p2  ORF type:complete len:118 (-),score=10.39 gb/GEZJ01004032.1/:312-665(-)